MSAAPLVTACVPAWNAASFVEETLAALAAQTHPRLRILVADDASTDGTAAICERFAAGDARFRVIRRPVRLGWVGNVNALLAEAEGDHLLIAAHDDHPLPRYVERLAGALDRHPRAVLAFSDVEAVHVDGRRETRVYRALDGVGSAADRARRLLAQTAHWSTPFRGVVRVAAVAEAGGLRRHAAGEFSADWPWLVRLALIGELVRVPEVLLIKHYRPGGLSRSWDYGLRSWLAVAGSCAREIRRSRLPLAQALPLYALLARRARWKLRRSWRRAPPVD
jgi:glycosyltransferase involved in cell wall biosynthesis